MADAQNPLMKLTQTIIYPVSTVSNFSKKRNYWHANRCVFQEPKCTDNSLPKKRNKIMQSAMLLQTTNDFKQLHNEVFSSMKPDKVSFVAQNDNLICSFGARLLQNHRQHHLIGYIFHNG